MDTPVVDALRYFLLPILAGGIIAVIAQRVAFHDARQLQEEEARRRRLGLLRALRAEIEENLRRISLGDDGTTLPGRTERSAWDAAREVDWPADVFSSIASAYTAGAELNDRIAEFRTSAAATAGVLESADARNLILQRLGQLGDRAGAAAKTARIAFERARERLSKVKGAGSS